MNKITYVVQLVVLVGIVITTPTTRTRKKTMKLPNNKYQIIYADPPWSYDNFQGKGKKYGDVSAHYTTMLLEDLKKLNVNILSDKNCILFMWATFPHLKNAIEVLESWGFKYITVAFVWVKTDSKGKYRADGLGFYTNSNAEIVLIGKKGTFQRQCNNVKQIIFSKKRQHSRKPDEIYQRIIDLCGKLPRIELFARQRIEGWDVWGNEVPTDTQKRLNPDNSDTEEN